MQIKVEDLLEEVGSYAKENALLKAQLKAYERELQEMQTKLDGLEKSKKE